MRTVKTFPEVFQGGNKEKNETAGYRSMIRYRGFNFEPKPER
jgi:hypothetical protein